MILVDTGPLVALFDPNDDHHAHCVAILNRAREPLYTTIPVLTEAFHILRSESVGSDRLRDFVERGGLSVWFLNATALIQNNARCRAFRDHVGKRLTG